MKVIKDFGKNFQDDLLKSKAEDMRKQNLITLRFNAVTSLMLNSTPLWPISDIKKIINHSAPKRNVCNTLPAYIHKYSRQGEKRPAIGNISGFQLSGSHVRFESCEDRVFLVESNGSRQKNRQKYYCPAVGWWLNS